MRSKISRQISSAVFSLLFTLLAVCGGGPQPATGNEGGNAAKATLDVLRIGDSKHLHYSL